MIEAHGELHRYGTRVRVTGILDPNDVDLNGRVGTLCRPFPGFPIQEAGVKLDATPTERKIYVSIKRTEFEVIE